MTAGQRAAFDRDGYLVIRAPSGLMPAQRRGRPRRTRPGIRGRGQVRPTESGRLAAPAQRGHELPGPGRPDRPPGDVPLVWSILGWNVHIYHSHLDVHPPLAAPKPDWWHWHQDGGRQNRELETDPRPRLSVKLAYWLSDVSEPGPRQPDPGPRQPPDQLAAGPAEPRRAVADAGRRAAGRPSTPATSCSSTGGSGTPARTTSPTSRASACSSATPTAGSPSATTSPPLPSQPWWSGLNPVQQQLLGGIGSDGDHPWGHDPETTPLYAGLNERGLLTPAHPPLRP